MGSNLGRVKLKTVKSIFAASALRMQYQVERAKIGCREMLHLDEMMMKYALYLTNKLNWIFIV
jgi:hypothetical protein